MGKQLPVYDKHPHKAQQRQDNEWRIVGIAWGRVILAALAILWVAMAIYRLEF